MDAKEVKKQEAVEKLRTAVVAELAKARGVEVSEIAERYVGNNGFEPGQQVTFTGDIEIIRTKGITPYYGAMLTNGSNVSVQSLMGISSMKGYEIKGEFENTIKTAKGETPRVTEKIAANVIENFDFTDVTQPTTRELYSFIAELKESNRLKGKTATYLGQVVRPYNAKKAGKMGDAVWNAQDPRCQVAKLWKY